MSAEGIVNGIVDDLTSRRGLSDEWGLISPEIIEEIKAEWTRLAQDYLDDHEKYILKRLWNSGK